ncbi:MAG: sigma-70 family RNA polymerase sigma factor [Oscillospiraceae bacterium]|nr:sigma-70 family RNA polymerase sigma factor [Oscillospiraceae bacterium]
MTDEEIVALLEKRNDKGLKALSQKFSRLILKISRNILGSQTDAEECLNDTLLAVWNAIPPDKPNNLAAYVAKIARRKTLNRLRYNTAPTRNSELLAELDECLPSNMRSVEEAAELSELTNALNGWLDTLSETHKRLFMERYFNALPIKDAARLCAMSLTAATSALSRMRASLKAYLEERSLL